MKIISTIERRRCTKSGKLHECAPEWIKFHAGKEDHVTVEIRSCFGYEGSGGTEAFAAWTTITSDEIRFTTEGNDEGTLVAEHISCSTPRLEIMTAGMCMRLAKA